MGSTTGRGLRGSRFLQRPPMIWRGVVWVACGDVARRLGMVFVSHGSATSVSDGEGGGAVDVVRGK